MQIVGYSVETFQRSLNYDFLRSRRGAQEEQTIVNWLCLSTYPGSLQCTMLSAHSRAVNEPSRISQCPEKGRRPPVWAFSVLLGPSRGLLGPSRGLLGDSRTFWDLLGPSGTFSDLLRVFSGLLLPSQSHLWT